MNAITPQTNDLTLAVALPTDQSPAAVYLAGLAVTGRRSQREALDTIAGLLGADDCMGIDWASLRFQHTAAIRTALIDKGYKAATVNKFLCAVRGVLKAAWRLGQMTAEDYQRAADIESVKGETLPAGRDLSSGELNALMAACGNDTTPAGARDAAIIAVLYTCGLRREEVVGLELGDYDTNTGRLAVTGKRNKERSVFLVNGAASAVADWLAIRGNEPGALFMSIRRGGHLTGKGMTAQAIYSMLADRANEAGVKEFSPHDLRRSCAGDMLDSGVDIVTVSKVLGHSSVQTTARYDRRPDEAKRKAAGTLHIAYRKRMV